MHPVVWSLLILAEFQSLVAQVLISSGSYQVSFGRAGLHCVPPSILLPSGLQRGIQQCLEGSIT